MSTKRITRDRLAQLRKEYESLLPRAERFADELSSQLNQLFENEDLPLTFPIQTRVKSWSSITDKLQRRSLRVVQVADITDVIGLRLILQFRRDVDRVCELIDRTLTVQERFDTAARLKEDEFGYGSVHFLVEVPKEWLKVPTLAPLTGLRAEIQVRTTAQHIWASASHKLQYKQEASVPGPLRRSIHRVSALLEMVDLEFERVLEEREQYRIDISNPDPKRELNVDVLANLLEQLLPEANKDPTEDYDLLLRQLKRVGITTTKKLTQLIKEHRQRALAEDAQYVQRVAKNPENYTRSNRSRAKKGVYFTYTGLIRRMADYTGLNLLDDDRKKSS